MNLPAVVVECFSVSPHLSNSKSFVIKPLLCLLHERQKGLVPSSQALRVLFLASVGEELSWLQTRGHGVDRALPARPGHGSGLITGGRGTSRLSSNCPRPGVGVPGSCSPLASPLPQSIPVCRTADQGAWGRHHGQLAGKGVNFCRLTGLSWGRGQTWPHLFPQPGPYLWPLGSALASLQCLLPGLELCIWRNVYI